MVPRNVVPAGRKAAAPTPCRALVANIMGKVRLKPPTSDHIINHEIPPRYTGKGPYMSTRRPKGSKSDPVTREKTEVGQVFWFGSMPVASMRTGSKTIFLAELAAAYRYCHKYYKN